jgi:hypothetical protein
MKRLIITLSIFIQTVYAQQPSANCQYEIFVGLTHYWICQDDVFKQEVIDVGSKKFKSGIEDVLNFKYSIPKEQTDLRPAEKTYTSMNGCQPIIQTKAAEYALCKDGPVQKIKPSNKILPMKFSDWNELMKVIKKETVSIQLKKEVMKAINDEPKKKYSENDSERSTEDKPNSPSKDSDLKNIPSGSNQ